MFRTISLLLAASTAALLMTGCSREDLSDREFIMSCQGELKLQSRENLSDLPILGGSYEGITLPTANVLYDSVRERARGRAFVTSEIGFSYEVGRFDSNVSGHPVGEFGGARSTYNAQVQIGTPRLGQPTSYHDPQGQSRITHYYLTRNGEMFPVNTFSLARIVHSQGNRVANFHVAGVLPSDAAYAVYHIDMRAVPVRREGGDRTIVNGLSGYWVTPLTDELRYQPLEADQGDVLDARSRRLGPYVRQPRFKADRERQGIGGARGERRASASVKTAPCFMQPGIAHNFGRFFFDPAVRTQEGYDVPEGTFLPLSGRRFGDRSTYFVGTREDLDDLPRNPRRFKGETGRIWPNLERFASSEEGLTSSTHL